MLTLYAHPLASNCHKVLIALYESGTAFDVHRIDLGREADRALMASLTPLGKMPALRDGDRVVAETSVIIEYLDLHHPGPRRMVPADPDAALEVRVWDRIMDAHVAAAFQPVVDARLFMDPAAEAPVTAHARRQLDRAYGALDRRLAGRAWLAGDFSLADCSAAPALFYAGVIHSFDGHPNLAAYFDRLLARPSVARVVAECRPWLEMFPFADLMPDRLRYGEEG